MTGKNYKPKRGEVYLAQLPDNGGSVQNGIRPVVILQNNIINNVFNSTIVAALSSSDKALEAKGNPMNVFLDKGCGIKKDSVVKLSQIMALDPETTFKKYLTKLTDDYMDKIEKSINYTLFLGEKCNNCGSLVSEEQLHCINCNKSNKKRCENCESILNLDWNYCPYCGRRYSECL